MPKILQIGGATDAMLARLSAFDITELYGLADAPAWLAQNGAGIEYVLTNGHDGIKPDVMAALPDVKLISCYGVGYDAIDTTTAVERGITVTHTPNVLNDEVATTTIMLMLACYRNLINDDAYVRAGKWEAEGNTPLTRSADNRRVGILGLGRIGQAIADKLAAFNSEISYHSRNQKDVPYKYYGDLTKMARDVEVLICITPGGPATDKIVNREVIEALGSDGTLINVSRGSVVDEAEMIAALSEGRLGWAGLDVFEAEPKVPAELRALKNVVLLPHVGSATVETRAAMGNLTVDNILQYQKDATVISAVPECK
ncbi:putative D-isomer specific 2-hydroxyacid dehydrogenase [Rhodobacterales bacterium HTCC2150]|nr:putative D-isomer specific 2-hydroxyacid dehydrogenase [Rhodobacterales bacterium HTCC2150] [Rhodobacteraceae bacterium HTCC2150]